MSDDQKGPKKGPEKGADDKEPQTQEQENPAAPARAQVIFLKGRSNELETLRRTLVMDERNEVQESSSGWAPQLAKKTHPCIVIADARDEVEWIKVLTLCKSLVNEIRAKQVKVVVVSKLAGTAFSKQLEFYGHIEYIHAPIAEKALQFKTTVLTKALQEQLEKKFETERRRHAMQAGPMPEEAEGEGEKRPNLQIVKGSTAPDVSTEFVRVGRPKKEEAKKPLGHLMDLAMKFEKEEPEGKSTVKTEHFLNPKWRRRDLSPEQKAEYRQKLGGSDEAAQWRSRMAPEGTPPKAAIVQPETPHAKHDSSSEAQKPQTSSHAPNPFSSKPAVPVREWKVRTRGGTPQKAANVQSETPELKREESSQAQQTKHEDRPLSSSAPEKRPAFHESARKAPAKAAAKNAAKEAPASLSLISLAVQWSDILYASGPQPEEGDAVGAVLKKYCEMLRAACDADGVAVLKCDSKGRCALLAEAASSGSTFGALDSVHVESAERAVGAGAAAWEEIEGVSGMIEAYFPLKEVSGAVVVRFSRENPVFKQLDQLTAAARLVRGVLGGLGGRSAA